MLKAGATIAVGQSARRGVTARAATVCAGRLTLLVVVFALGTALSLPAAAQDPGASAAVQSANASSAGSRWNAFREGVEALIRSFASQGEGITPLMKAARSNDLTALKRQLASGAEVNATSRHGWTALMFAAGKGHAESVELLLDAGADPDLVSRRITGNTQAPTPRTTALAEAARGGHLAVANMLLARGASVDPMAVAVAGGLDDISLLKQMHARGADLNRVSGVEYYPTALSVACLAGKPDNVRWLIEQGARPDQLALNNAVGGDHVDVVQLLVADDAAGRFFSEPELSAALHHAATKFNTPPENFARNLQVIKLLLARGADPDYQPSGEYGIQQTALGYLQDQRVDTVKRIELNRYGESQLSWEKGWLNHRDTIVELLESSSTAGN